MVNYAPDSLFFLAKHPAHLGNDYPSIQEPVLLFWD